MEAEPAEVYVDRLVGGARLEPHEWLLPSGAPSEVGDGVAIALSERTDVHLERDAWAACGALAESVVEEPSLASSVDASEVRVELLREVGRMLQRKESVTAAALIERVVSYLSKSVVVIPVGGMYSSAPGPIRLGDHAVIGHISRETESAIADFAREFADDLAGFRFTDDAWWTEDFLAAEEDGEIAAEIAAAEEEGGTWQPLVVAVGVDGVGGEATYIASTAVEALIGAAIVADNPKELDFLAPPWILGETTYSETPRYPVLGDDLLLPTAPLIVDTRPGRQLKAQAPGYLGRLGLDVDIGELIASPPARSLLTRAVAGAVRNDIASDAYRVSTACRILVQTIASPPDLGVLLAAAALQMLAASNDLPAETEGGLTNAQLQEQVTESLGLRAPISPLHALALSRSGALQLLRRAILDVEAEPGSRT